jgi:hypothetical protein
LERNNGVWRRRLQGRLKKYYPQGGDFFKPLALPLQACFCGTKGAIDEYRFTCVVFCVGTLIMTYTVIKNIPKFPLVGIWGI